MLEIDGQTIAEVFDAATRRFASRPFLQVPKDAERDYYQAGAVWSFDEVSQQVAELSKQIHAAGYGHGHRVAVLLENRPEMLVWKLALSRLGISWVPLNPEYRAAEIAYVVTDADVEFVVSVAALAPTLKAALGQAMSTADLVVWPECDGHIPDATRDAPKQSEVISPRTEASLLYTSGTTGRPKGCMISHEYELMMGAWYASRSGCMALQEGTDKLYNPLPLFHVNGGIVSFYGMMLSGNALIIPQRFSRSRWWSDIRACDATACHYLGVIIPVLMTDPPGDSDRDHKVRWGFGAGVEPTLHRAFEERFGITLIEGWGMTEMCRILVDNHEPRLVHTRAMGRPMPELEVRVVDDRDRDVAVGSPGEMLVRHSADTPRKGAFSGYLNREDATEEGWRGGWWHTGDTVCQDETGMLYFVDRKKNIIRRSGENIAAAEVEAVLQGEPSVAQVAVLAVGDELRDEEVLACIVTKGVRGDAKLAQTLFDTCYEKLAYYKPPGWIVFVDALPVTGTQKVLKHMIFGEGVDPTALPDAHDLRDLKKRSV